MGDDETVLPRPKRLLLIGGSGYVGTQLAHSCKDKGGYIVDIFDTKLPHHTLLDSIRR